LVASIFRSPSDKLLSAQKTAGLATRCKAQLCFISRLLPPAVQPAEGLAGRLPTANRCRAQLRRGDQPLRLYRTVLQRFQRKGTWDTAQRGSLSGFSPFRRLCCYQPAGNRPPAPPPVCAGDERLPLQNLQRNSLISFFFLFQRYYSK
jgi:hypothetical protein